MPGYDGKVVQLNLCREHWRVLEDTASVKRGGKGGQSLLQVPNFRAYFRSAIHRLSTEGGLCTAIQIADKTMVQKSNNNFPIPEEDRPQLEAMAKRFGITVGRLCAILIVHPLIREHYDTNGFCASRSA